MKSFSFLFLIFWFSFSLGAQNDPLASINQDLRTMFEGLDKPQEKRHYLYDMTAHMANESFFTHYSTELSNTDNWFMIYDEVYNAAYDTASIETGYEIAIRGNSFANAIPIGVVDNDFYRFKDDALNTDTYFDFDIPNNKIIDKYPRPDYPYDTKNLFVAAPLVGESNYGNVTFRIDPDFILKDEFNSDFYTNRRYLFRVDFGDGKGWITFNPNQVTEHEVLYPKAGDYKIKVAIFGDAEKTTKAELTKDLADVFLPVLVPFNKYPIKLSTVSFRVTSSVQTVLPQGFRDEPGLNVSVFRGCNNEKLNKVIIFLEGFDVLDFLAKGNTDGAELFTDYIKGEGLADLMNYGYDFLVVDWKNSRLAMETNADFLIDFINKLKCELGTDQQFIIIGHSMGGVIGRFALTKMENARFAGECSPEQMHNTRLLITIDSPHQGANIPLSVQHFYNDALSGFGVFGKATPILSMSRRLLFEGFNLFLEANSAQEMIVPHYATKNGFSNPTIYADYGAHSRRANFLDKLATLGGHPQFCKTIALSNGAMNGNGQTRAYDGALRQANDELLKFDSKIFVRVLGIKIPLFGAKLDMKTNPDGDGLVYKREAGTWKIRVKVYWFGIKITAQLDSWLNKEEYARTQPICTNQGGIIIGGVQPGNRAFDKEWSNENDPFYDGFLFKVKRSNDGNGTYEFLTTVGVPWLANLNLEAKIYSDGFHFNFIPTASALDFNTSSFNTNIEDMPISAMMNSTPFDIIAGIHSSLPSNTGTELRNIRRFNRHHGNVENRIIRPAPNTTDAGTYYSVHMSCTEFTNGEGNPVYVLNREIGDDKMWLENLNLNRNALFESEYDIHLNARNPYYVYPSQTGTNFTVAGFYSNENPFQYVGDNGWATFKWDPVNTPSGIGLDEQPPYLVDFDNIEAPLEICCVDYSGEYRIRPNVKKMPDEKGKISIFPNPTTKSEITLNFVFPKEGDFEMQIYDIYGRLIHTRAVSYPHAYLQRDVDVDLSSLSMSSGIYLVTATNMQYKVHKKFVIQD